MGGGGRISRLAILHQRFGIPHRNVAVFEHEDISKTTVTGVGGQAWMEWSRT
jgi:hypothetical protein